MPSVSKQKPPKKTTTTKRKPKEKGILSKVQSLEDDLDTGGRFSLYGLSGTGKTTLWATFPGRILAVVCSGGVKPGELKSIDTPEYRKKIDKINISKSSEVVEIIKMVHEEPERYATVVIDHLSGLQDLILAELLELDEIPLQKEWGMATQQDYGQLAIQMKTILRDLLGLPINVVFVAQERAFNFDDEENGSPGLLPFVSSALIPSVVGWLNPAVDYLCQTFKRNKVIQKTKVVKGKKVTTEVTTDEMEYCLRTGPHELYMTKFRKPKTSSLPPVIVDPTYDKIMEAIDK